MSIATEIAAIQASVTKLRDKGVELGIAISEDKLADLATKYTSDLVDVGVISAQVSEGETYNIPKGYHPGNGTVSGVGGGGSYNLQDKSVTPTKSQQVVNSDEGYYGLSQVTVAPIPAVYQDVGSVTAGAPDVLATKVFVTQAGTVAGSMPNVGTVAATIDGLSVTSYIVPRGYHGGEGTVSLTDDIETALAAI